MSKQVEEFFVIFDEVRAMFESRGLTDENHGSLDVIEKIAVHLNMNNTPRQSAIERITDGQEGKVTGKLEGTNKRNVETKNGTRTAFDITVDGFKYSTFDKKLFPTGLAVDDVITVKFRQNGKFRNLVEITKDGQEDSDIPF